MGLIMCLDNRELVSKNCMQKNVRLGRLLKDHTKFLTEDELRLEENSMWRPISFATTVRSVYSNKVVYFNDTKNNRRLFYHTLTDIDKMIHTGYDLVMFLSSQSLMCMLSEDADKFRVNDIMSSSEYICKGLYYYEVIDPIVYSDIIIEDRLFDSLCEELDSNYKTCSISEAKEYNSGNIQALLNDMIEVKK